MKQNPIVVSVADPMKWFFSQLGQLVIAVGLISLIALLATIAVGIVTAVGFITRVLRAKE